MAILPGVALSELWQMMSMFENVWRLISPLVLLAAVLGMGAVLLSSIRERRQEILLLRMMGAQPLYLFFLIEMEASYPVCARNAIRWSQLVFGLIILLGDAVFHASVCIWMPHIDA